MKTRISRILFSFFLFIIPAIYLSSNAYAGKDNCVFVDPSAVSLSPKDILDFEYLNSPEIKHYLIEAIRLSCCFSEKILNEIKQKSDYVNFFCFENALHDNMERVILRMWIPLDVQSMKQCGTLISLPIDYPLLDCMRGRSNTI